MMSQGSSRGLGAGTLAAVRDVLRARKLRWLFAFLSAQSAPFLEAAFMACLYFAVDTSKQASFLEKMGTIRPLGLDLAAWPQSRLTVAFCTTGLLLLVASIVIRYANEKNLVRLQYDFYVQDSQFLIQQYLHSSTQAISRINRERVTTSILIDCGSSSVVAKQLLAILMALCAMSAYLVGAAMISWKLLLVAVGIYGLPLYLSRRLYDKMQHIGRLKAESQEGIVGYFGDLLSGFERSKIDGLEEALRERSGSFLARSQEWRLRKRRTQAWMHVLLEGVPLLGVFGVAYAGLVLFDVGAATLLVLLVIFNLIKGHVGKLSEAYLSVKEVLPNVHRHMALMRELDASEPERPHLSRIEDVREVAIENVDFAYKDRLILEDATFVAWAGDRILVQGPSGQGKSTFLEVLCGLLPPRKGRVSYNGLPLDKSLFYRVRSSIAYASPAVYLFRGSLRDNLLMGHPHAGQAALDRALELSGLDEVVGVLPQGLDSPIGTNGDTLSLGQRQRVILARLYLKRPSLILLDEATANIDPALESRLMKNLLAFIDPQAILIMVAHKAPASVEFNRRFVMEDGQLRECPAAAPEGAAAPGMRDA